MNVAHVTFCNVDWLLLYIYIYFLFFIFFHIKIYLEGEKSNGLGLAWAIAKTGPPLNPTLAWAFINWISLEWLALYVFISFHDIKIWTCLKILTLYDSNSQFVGYCFNTKRMFIEIMNYVSESVTCKYGGGSNGIDTQNWYG